MFTIRALDTVVLSRMKLGQFVRFGVVGLSNSAISFFTFQASFALLKDMKGGAGFAQLLGYAAGIVWSFFWNRKLTFRSVGHLSRQAFRFVVLQLFLAGLSALLVWVCVSFAGWSATLSWLLVMVPFTLLNFVLCKQWAFVD